MSFLRNNKYFLLPFLLYMLVGAYLNISYTQKDLFFAINSHYSSPSDYFFRYYTNVGDGQFFIWVIVILAFFRYQYAIVALVSWVMQGLIVQLMKQVIFSDHDRPWLALSADPKIHLVHDFHPFVNNSFPSGHSATAFCMFAILSFMIPKKWFGLLFFILALAVAFSRIYLVQHFFLDTYFGAIIGIACALFSYIIFMPRLNTVWGHKNLITLKPEDK